MAEGVPPQTVRKTDSLCDTGTDGRTAEGGEASGADERTGWEAEREIFFAAQNQTAQAAPVASGMGLAALLLLWFKSGGDWSSLSLLRR